MSDNNTPSPKQDSLWIDGLKTIGLSLFLAFGIRASIAQSFFIPSGSMEPTLQVGDRLMVDKLSYRFTNPDRGDIVVFSPPKAALANCGLPQNSSTPFIKRIIGLPGETVEVKSGSVFVNSRPIPESYITAPPQYQWGPTIVPSNSYFLLGDNRNNSCDGHAWGFVPRDRLIGRAFVRFWPPDRMGSAFEEQKR